MAAATPPSAIPTLILVNGFPCREGIEIFRKAPVPRSSEIPFIGGPGLGSENIRLRGISGSEEHPAPGILMRSTYVRAVPEDV
ncbi:MAG: hypothetical protein R6T96_01185 [Longimicrobiales bacterium]